MNYHDLEKAREAARKIPGGSGGGQAARNTGPVIRIAVARRREKLVMAGLLTDTGDVEKPELSAVSCRGIMVVSLLSWFSLHDVPLAPIFRGKWQRSQLMSSLHTKVRPEADPADAAIPDTATERFLVHVTRVEGLRQRGFSSDEIYKIVGPRRTLARRKERNETLTITESDRVQRLERVSAMADRVFGSHEKAQRWLRKRSRVLNEIPINLLQSETGAVLVEEELHRIDYGILA
ncbi:MULTISPECIES: antitoxin Xre/MbcA/ParS toxin-binding domain-containing protein [unclassified Mesorhizobium]|uniref:antitoxin Xre/MbcA/ParS toxin-binding domain-containing protein n=1 Tax=unclassified Mesorhizobium TaxID=325217 RepID=UPI0033354E62